MNNRVIVTAHKIIQAGFRIEIIASVSEGIEHTDMIWVCNKSVVVILDIQKLSGNIIGVACNGLPLAVHYLHYVALEIFDVIVHQAVVAERRGSAALVIVEEQGLIVPLSRPH